MVFLLFALFGLCDENSRNNPAPDSGREGIMVKNGALVVVRDAPARSESALFKFSALSARAEGESCGKGGSARWQWWGHCATVLQGSLSLHLQCLNGNLDALRFAFLQSPSVGNMAGRDTRTRRCGLKDTRASPWSSISTSTSMLVFRLPAPRSLLPGAWVGYGVDSCQSALPRFHLISPLHAPLAAAGFSGSTTHAWHP